MDKNRLFYPLQRIYWIKNSILLVYSSTSNNIYYKKKDWEKPCHNSSCEPTATGRRSKKRSRMHTESLTDFFDLFFWCKGILNGFASVTACGYLGSDCRVICYYLVHIYCPKESKCHALARFVLFVRLVFEKNIFAYELYSVDHKSPESHEYIPCRNLKDSLDSCD